MTKSKAPNTALRQQMHARHKAKASAKLRSGFLSQDKFPSVQTEHFDTNDSKQADLLSFDSWGIKGNTGEQVGERSGILKSKDLHSCGFQGFIGAVSHQETVQRPSRSDS